MTRDGIEYITTIPNMVAITEPSQQSIKLPDPNRTISIPVSITIERPKSMALSLFLFLVVCITLVNSVILFFIILGISPLARG